jgi:Bacterial Ig domain
MADTAEPMIKLEPGGQAPILSYNVPEPTSYSGRNYIEFRFPDDYFIEEVNAQGIASEPSPFMAPSRERQPDDPVKAGIRGAAGLLRFVERPDGPAIVSTEPLSPKLERLHPDHVAELAQEGKEVTVYRSMFGTLTFAVTTHAAQFRNGGGSDDPPGVVAIVVEITSPLDGDTVTGPTNGVNLNVSGWADVTLGEGDIAKVELCVGGEAFHEATPHAPGDWSQWTGTVSLAQSGSQTITARATHETGKTRSKAVTVKVVLSAPPTADQTPPQIAITSPSDGSVITAPNPPASVNLEGTASDADSGVRLIELTLDRDPTTTIEATPKTTGDWSTWSASVSFGAGSHSVTARCTDNAGNVAERTLTLTVAIRPPTTPVRTRLVLAETYRLSSFLGTYGAGRTIKTFSLLPGEKTKISVKSFTRSEEQAKSASTILDSFTQESADDFETTVGNEQTNKEGYDESFKYKVGAEAQASWGFGSAKISAEVSGGTNASREEFAKNVSNATQKHTAKASAKRDVQINTSYESKAETGEETSLEREIANINVGRTLNFVFRQMNQEFITILHLVDVRVGLFKSELVDGNLVETYREAALPELDSLLARAIVPARRSEVRNTIRNMLSSIPDYNDELKSIVQLAVPKDADGNEVPDAAYLRIDRRLVTTYQDSATGTAITVPGLILSADKSVLRTEGVIVEALLGQGEGLDDYSRGLQDSAVAERQLQNARLQADVDKDTLARALVVDKDAEGAKIFEEVYPPPPAPVLHELEPTENGARQPA